MKKINGFLSVFLFGSFLALLIIWGTEKQGEFYENNKEILLKTEEK